MLTQLFECIDRTFNWLHQTEDARNVIDVFIAGWRSSVGMSSANANREAVDAAFEVDHDVIHVDIDGLFC